MLLVSILLLLIPLLATTLYHGLLQDAEIDRQKEELSTLAQQSEASSREAKAREEELQRCLDEDDKRMEKVRLKMVGGWVGVGPFLMGWLTAMWGTM